MKKLILIHVIFILLQVIFWLKYIEIIFEDIAFNYKLKQKK
jgi:hypothetical protein